MYIGWTFGAQELENKFWKIALEQSGEGILAQKEILSFPDQLGVVKGDDFASPGELEPETEGCAAKGVHVQGKKGASFKLKDTFYRPQNKAC
jgi:hypothetical protein